MSFRSLELEPEYNSIRNDVYGEFFNKVLQYSSQYVRVGGKFTSRNFAACAEGLQKFVERDGLMKLVLVPEFTEEDINSIDRGLKNQHNVLAERWIRDISQIKEKFVEDHVKALAWMLAHGNLEIRLAIPVRGNGSIMSSIDLKDSEIFQRKTGIFWDSANEAVSFTGNIDFDNRMLGEYQRIRVFRGWDAGERRFVEKDLEEFHVYWDGQEFGAGLSLKTIPLPDAIRENLVKVAPKSKSDIHLQNLPKLRPYQMEAVAKWLGNGARGIFEMATGTGKTFTAIGCLKEIKNRGEKTLVVIVCPSDNLERQWKEELAKWDFASFITSQNRQWRQRVKDKLASLEIAESAKMQIVITTYKNFSSGDFLRIIEGYDGASMLIADEVHNAGATESVRGLTNAYSYRLGLSATVERYFDPNGTTVLEKFFEGVVYSMDLRMAISHGFLVSYYYYPIYVDLNEDEYAQYRRITKIIASLWSSKRFEDRKKLELALMRRSRIIQNAQSKIQEFERWIQRNPDSTKYLLVYCSDKHIDQVKSALSAHGVINREITAKNPANPAERADIIKQFSAGLYHAVVAIKVLDEGADIPTAKNCIMMASTGNPKQFIQRRGRVLRQFSGQYRDGSAKRHAIIYDILVIPDLAPDYTEDEICTERQIVASQIKRQELMADTAINRDSCMKEITKIKKRFLVQ